MNEFMCFTRLKVNRFDFAEHGYYLSWQKLYRELLVMAEIVQSSNRKLGNSRQVCWITTNLQVCWITTDSGHSKV